MLPAIIDIEASGFGRGSYPIEVGIVLPDGASYCSLIRPAPRWKHWDESAARLHHITPQILTIHGRPALEVASGLNQRLRNQIVYSDGWANDYSWLGLLFDEVDMIPAFRIENLRMILSDDEAARWHATKEAVLASTHQLRHRASTDASVIQRTVARLRAAS
ncbi:MAG: hypothetical protein EXR28_03045 [Betaproteobacteria bacterium]|nr:hypothetical protein [Betaproteobacteria bacterium]